MVSRYYRDKLQAAVTSLNDVSIESSATDWDSNAILLKGVADSIRESSKTLDSEIEGEAGKAMVAKFRAISDKLALDAEDMSKGSGALVVAHTAAIAAMNAHKGIATADAGNTRPVKREGPIPGVPAAPKQDTAQSDYTTGMQVFEANEQTAEDNARKALEQMDLKYAEAALVMKEIHGEPDPEQPSGPNLPTGGNPGTSVPPVHGPGNPTTEPPQQPPVKDPTVLPPRHEDPPHLNPTDHPTDHTTTTHDTTSHTTTHTTHGTVDIATTNVQGGTDGGTSYQGVNAGGSSSTGSAGGTGAGVGGAAAAGVAGAGLGAGMMKGGAVGGSARAASAGPVRGIGAGARAGAPSSLSRGAAAGSTARGAASSGSRAGASARSAAAGSTSSKGSATKGGVRSGSAKGGAARTGAAGSTSSKGATKGKVKGLFRRGANGSTTGGRSNKKNDERGTDRDSLVYEQDWLGEDTAAPGVLD